MGIEIFFCFGKPIHVRKHADIFAIHEDRFQRRIIYMARSFQKQVESLYEVECPMIPELMKETEGYGRFQILNVSKQDDGYGGYKDTYSPGATFEGVLFLNDSINAQAAMSQGVTGVYTLTYNKELRLPWHTVFCKETDSSRTYRVTSKDEQSSPGSSNLDMRVVNCEEWEIPTNGQPTGS